MVVSRINTFEELRARLVENEADPRTGGKDSEINKIFRALAEAYARQVGFSGLDTASGPAPRELRLNEETQTLYNRLKEAKKTLFFSAPKVRPKA